MSDITLNVEDIVSILKKMAGDMKEHIDELRELDAIIGDGDLGVTMELGANAIIAFEPTAGETDVGKMLARCGMNINRANPSTFGTLLTSAFMGAGKEVQNKSEVGYEELMLMGRGAVAGIKNRGKAEVGDKTMLDSLVPAVEAFEDSVGKSQGIVESLKAAVSQAETGMQATAGMKAKLGRGSYRQDGTVGVRDGGAVAMYYLIESFARHLSSILDSR